MSPRNIQQIQKELAILWDDGTESYISLEKLRRYCPCAGCAGEKDVFGREYRGASQGYNEKSFQLIRFEQVGGYAINFSWADGHHTGIYTFEFLKRLGETPA